MSVSNVTVVPSPMVSTGRAAPFTSTSQVTTCASVASQVSELVIAPQCSAVQFG
ncbi:MAG: hypothetical protein R3F59_12340 [Myxococcota bacterium]